MNKKPTMWSYGTVQCLFKP